VYEVGLTPAGHSRGVPKKGSPHRSNDADRLMFSLIHLRFFGAPGLLRRTVAP
jgi:hypothetical protein